MARLLHLLVAAVLAMQLVLLTQQQQLLLEPAEVRALAEVKRELSDQPGSSFLSSWEFGTADACTSFAGVVCEEGHVVQLNLGDASSPRGLAGRVSPWIGNLTHLRQLTLVPGAVEGRLPDTLGSLVELQFLAMSRNQLQGCIPDDAFSRFSRLEVLDLSGNALQCDIPPSLARLPALEALDLSHNRLTGSMPCFLPSSSMTHLDLSSNRLTGELPASLPRSLAYVAADNNELSGTLSSLARLRRLMSVDLSSNHLSGGIPEELLSDNPGLMSLLLQRNRLSGPILVKDAAAIRIGRLDLSFNELSGPIPAALAGVRSSLFLNNNRFTGQVPPEFASAQLHSLYLQHNFLTRFPPLLLQQASAPLICLEYNCLEPPASQSVCPGKLATRPTSQCSSLTSDLP